MDNWESAKELKSLIKQVANDVVKEKTRDCFRVFKAVVLKAPYYAENLGNVCQVRLNGDNTVLTIPYSSRVSDMAVGDTILVATVFGSFRNAIAWEKLYFNYGMLFPKEVSGTGLLELDDISVIPSPMSVSYEGDVSQTSVTCCGKNLLSYPYFETTHEEDGIKFTDNGDGTITVKGNNTSDTALADFYFKQGPNDHFRLPRGTYTFSCFEPRGRWALYAQDRNNNTIGSTYSGTLHFEITEELAQLDLRFWLRVFFNSGEVDMVLKPMLVQGSSAAEYEQYKGETKEIPQGETVSFNSVPPMTNVFPYDPSVTLNVKYKVDTSTLFD